MPGGGCDTGPVLAACRAGQVLVCTRHVGGEAWHLEPSGAAVAAGVARAAIGSGRLAAAMDGLLDGAAQSWGWPQDEEVGAR